MPYYAVKKGHSPGVYTKWGDVQKQINGFQHPVFRKFENEDEAREFIKTYTPKPITEFFATTDPLETDKSLICFTDGSTLNNGKEDAKGAFAVVWPYHEELNYAEKVFPATNNICEYNGAIYAIKQADVLDPEREKSLIIYTDSQLLINSLTLWLPNWKKNNYCKADGKIIANLELVKTLETLISQRKVVFRHVKAHTSQKTWEAIHNDKVDKLARSTCMS